MEFFTATDIKGQKFGRLLVISPAKSKHKRAYWNCQCDCGNTCIAMGKYLRQGKKRSCGCLKKESAQINAKAMTASNNLPPGVAAFNLLYAGYRCSAETRSIEFNLTKDNVAQLTKQDCFYCGAPPKILYAPDLPNGGYIYNGIDRKDSSVGYNLDNCVACCKMCNWMKNAFTVEDFISQCSRIIEHQNSKNQKGI
jgi:hypothetical protein